MENFVALFVGYLSFIVRNLFKKIFAANTVVSNSIKISRNFKLLYIRNGFQIRIPRPNYACAENFKYIRQRERPL